MKGVKIFGLDKTERKREFDSGSGHWESPALVGVTVARSESVLVTLVALSTSYRRPATADQPPNAQARQPAAR